MIETLKKPLKHGSKRLIKGIIGFTLKSINQVLSGIKKKRGLILIEFLPDSRSRYSQEHPHPKLNQTLGQHFETYKQNFEHFLQYDHFFSIPQELNRNAPSIPNLKNYFLTGLDALALYATVCKYKPQKFVEIGSGHSTKFVRQAIKDYQLDTKIISIDPYPRTEIDEICDQVIREPIEETDLSIFQKIEPGDIIFIDSSHYTLQNSDVTVIFTEVLPFIKPGVLIHVHDIYLPWDYPPPWVERNYSEQYLLMVMLLTQNPDYDVIFPCYYLTQNDDFRKLFSESLSVRTNQPLKLKGNSFWMKKRA